MYLKLREINLISISVKVFDRILIMMDIKDKIWEEQCRKEMYADYIFLFILWQVTEKCINVKFM